MFKLLLFRLILTRLNGSVVKSWNRLRSCLSRSANICWDPWRLEDVLKTYLEDVISSVTIFHLPRRLQDVFKITSRRLDREQFITLKTFSKLLKTYLGPSIKYVRKIFLKSKISYPLIRTRTCAYQGVRNVGFLKNFA